MAATSSATDGCLPGSSAYTPGIETKVCAHGRGARGGAVRVGAAVGQRGDRRAAGARRFGNGGRSARDEANRKRRAARGCRPNAWCREHELPMKVVGVDALPDGRVTIYFSADHRIDFRALVRDLGRTLACRVELRQLSARDEARVQGDIGPCGRDLCCSTFLKDFEPVSIRMAKDQDLQINPLSIAGACGRLMYCLRTGARCSRTSVRTPRGSAAPSPPKAPAPVTRQQHPLRHHGDQAVRDGQDHACPASICGSPGRPARECLVKPAVRTDA